MSLKNFVILIIKIILDVSSRILLFSAWMYTSSDGNFSIWKTLIAFYSIVIMLVLFNIGFNSSKEFPTARYWIGIVLNSTSSVLSFNSIEFHSLLGERMDVKHLWHQHTFVKQLFYTILFTIVNIG